MSVRPLRDHKGRDVTKVFGWNWDPGQIGSAFLCHDYEAQNMGR